MYGTLRQEEAYVRQHRLNLAQVHAKMPVTMFMQQNTWRAPKQAPHHGRTEARSRYREEHVSSEDVLHPRAHRTQRDHSIVPVYAAGD